MRAKTVHTNAWIFDFDDTLVKTDAKVHIMKNNKRVKSITPEEYNTYILQAGEYINADDFADPRFIINARKYKMWPELKRVDMANKMGKLSDDIYILTARDKRAKLPIHNFLTKENIDIPLENIITVSPVERGEGEESYTSYRKFKVLKEMIKDYDTIFFFDDSQENIDMARKIPNIETRLIEKYIK